MKSSGQDLFVALQTARRALDAWLACEFPIGGYIEAEHGEYIHSNYARGKVFRCYTDADGNPIIEAESDSGSPFSVNPLLTSLRVVPVPNK